VPEHMFCGSSVLCRPSTAGDVSASCRPPGLTLPHTLRGPRDARRLEHHHETGPSGRTGRASEAPTPPPQLSLS
jgi:hypothetical protein